MSEWNPICTAPEDGSDVLLLVPMYGRKEEGYIRVIGHFSNGNWRDSHGDATTDNLHSPEAWSEIPNLPK